MSRENRRDSCKSKNHPRTRQDYIDYDYLDQLNPEEREWLSRFTDEMYGADFEINTTYIKKNGKFVQITNNEDKRKNKDLRKYRHIKKYYKTSKGAFTTNLRNKYSQNNIHKTRPIRDLCNQKANAMNRDLSLKVKVNSTPEHILDLIDSQDSYMSPESFLILIEDLKECKND